MNSESTQVFLIGSSQSKLALFEAGEIKKLLRKKSTPENMTNFAFEGRQTLVVSVRPDLKESLSDKENLVFFDNETASKTFNLKGTYEKLGQDRLCNLIAAREILQTDKVGILDYGTCTTLSLLEGNDFKGGFIHPGISSSLQVLSLHTTSLPSVSELQFIEYCTKYRSGLQTTNTKEAICEGILLQNLGLINELTRTLKGYKLVLTGGWAGLIEELSGESFALIDASLPLKGGYFYLQRLLAK